MSTFPKQPSRKDGLGTMCAEHWKAYVKGLAADRKARQDAGEDPKPSATYVENVEAAERRAAKRGRAPKPSNGDAVAKAEALIAEVDALPAEASKARWGDDDVQAALALVGGMGHETPLGEIIDGGTEDAA